MSEKNVTDLSSGNSPELARALEATPAASEDVRERVDVPGLPDGITPLTGVFTTHHAGRPHAIVLWQGAPWLVWQHPDGHWVTEATVHTRDAWCEPKVTVVDRAVWIDRRTGISVHYST